MNEDGIIRSRTLDFMDHLFLHGQGIRLRFHEGIGRNVTGSGAAMAIKVDFGFRTQHSDATVRRAIRGEVAANFN